MVEHDLVDVWFTRAPISDQCPGGCLDDGERAVAGRRRSGDREVYVAAHVLLRHVLADQVGATPDALTFSQDSLGRPYLAGYPAIDFSLSHTHGLATLAIVRGHRVGIDIEAGRLMDSRVVAPAVLTLAEHNQLDGEPPAVRRRRIIEAWVMKEAFLKATGEGLRIDPRLVDTTRSQYGRIHRTDGRGPDAWSVHLLKAAHGIAVALVCDITSPTIVQHPEFHGHIRVGSLA
ncbi:MAG: 4'-phosphopantetheinyl transferase family protein [Arachnia sp.]